MEREELKLVFDALKQCNTYAFAGGLGLRATAHRDALAILEKALALPAQEPMCPECKAGVLYECVACSSNNYPAQAAQERNFCPRCGKRTADLTVIHTCTPPQETALEKI